MATLRKQLSNEIDELSLGELRQELLKSEMNNHQYVRLYEDEYQRSKMLQRRVDVLKGAQRKAHLEFRGFVE